MYHNNQVNRTNKSRQETQCKPDIDIKQYDFEIVAREKKNYSDSASWEQLSTHKVVKITPWLATYRVYINIVQLSREQCWSYKNFVVCCSMQS